MSKGAKSTAARTTVVPLDPAIIEIEWQAAPPSEDVLARLLLSLIGEDAMEEIFSE